jgi:tetratricopeptide (TPR) repeat protein
MSVILAGGLLLAATLSPHATPAERRIAIAEAAVARDPGSVRPRVDLAMALAGRARETADPSFYEQAEEALGPALAKTPDDYEAQRARVWIRLGQHRFAEARDEAQRLQKRAPDDLLVYGFLGDANMELGDYEAAEEALQWMLNLRPGNVAGLTRGAYFRETIGQVEGALQFMVEAFDRTPVVETEDRAWILTQVAHLQLSSGAVAEAESSAKRALELFPAYHYALAQLAAVRTAQGRHDEAAALLSERYQQAPHPENLYDVGRALERAGRKAEAKAAFTIFEQKAVAESQSPDNCNRELIAYYIAHGRAAEGLRLAEREVERRKDVQTLDAYAWALQANGRISDARKTIERALAVGTKDARVLYHAGAIAARAGDRAAARKHLDEAARVNATSEVAAEVERLRKRIG